jgi:hypothetical protein
VRLLRPYAVDDLLIGELGVPMRRKAGKESPGTINQPHLVVIGTAIPNNGQEMIRLFQSGQIMSLDEDLETHLKKVIDTFIIYSTTG